MYMRRIPARCRWSTIILMLSLGWLSAARASEDAKPPENLFANPSFEAGREPWRMDKAGKTAARLAVDDADAGAGRHSARLTMDAVDDWGVQFGQNLEVVQGKTYTLAVLGKSLKGPVTVRLELERAGKPWDRAGASTPQTLPSDRWTELHFTFRVEKAFPQGCFAYVSCQQAHADFRLDAFRLYQGEYVPYEEAVREEARAVAVSLFDTGSPSPGPLAGQALSRKPGWTAVPEDQTEHRFAGDAVMLNDRLALVLRRHAPGAELYARHSSDFRPRATLGPAGASQSKLAAVSIVDNGPSEVILDAEFAGAEGKRLGMRFSLGMGQAFVRTEPRQGAAALAIDAQCRFLVLPDFFADDIVIDAAEIPVASAELPSENFLLQMLPGGRSLLMTVSDSREQDTRVRLAGDGPKRLVQRTEIPYGKKGKIWAALLEGPGIWHQRDVGVDEAGKIVSIDWKAPFPAQWRVDWRQADRLTGSWEMIAERRGGEFEKYGWFGSPRTLPRDRQTWTTVLGSFPYPCWLDLEGRGYLQPLRKKPVRFEGPALVYPINRVKATPLDRFTVVDLVRATLGVGPCEYILDLEGQSAAMRGRATCATRDALRAIYGQKQQKARRAEIEQILDEVVVFVKHIRARIEQYADFGRQMQQYVESQRAAHGELAGFLDEMQSLAQVIQANYDKRKESIKTPEYVVDLTDRFRNTLLDYEGEDALAKCTEITHAIVVVGGNQDELVGESRMAVKVLRQRAGLAMAVDPRTAEIAKEIRRRTQQALRNPASYEAPRH